MTYRTDLRQVTALPEEERLRLLPVTERFPFRANDYYLSLIDWNDPNDPIRRLVIPAETELSVFGRWDPSDEAGNYVAKSCQHKYTTTALLLVSDVCGAYCRFCFRKRLFQAEFDRESSLDVSEGLAYIAAHPEINHVLLTGGDPLMLSSDRLDAILTALRAIPHLQVIRIGSKLPAYDPARILDPKLLATLARHSPPDARIYVICHFNHPRELTAEARRSIAALQSAGVILVNQTPLLAGVNDSPAVLGDLLNQLAAAGVTPYYVFQNRPVAGNAGFALPLGQAYAIVEAAKARTSGLAKRARFIMSHATGKLEILAVENDRIYLKYHQAKDPANVGRFLICHLPEDATWFDDLHPIADPPPDGGAGPLP